MHSSQVFHWEKNNEIAENAFSSKAKFLRLASFKISQFKIKKYIMQFKIKNFPFVLELLFCHYCDRRLTFKMLADIYWKRANFTVLNFIVFWQ